MSRLEAALEKPDHIRVLPGRWSWSKEEPWLKLEMVLATKFWSDDMYKPIRELLRHPVANPEIILGGEFITVDTTARKVQAVQAPQQPLPEPTQHHVPPQPQTWAQPSSTRRHRKSLQAPSPPCQRHSPQLQPRTGRGPAAA